MTQGALESLIDRLNKPACLLGPDGKVAHCNSGCQQAASTSVACPACGLATRKNIPRTKADVLELGGCRIIIAKNAASPGAGEMQASLYRSIVDGQSEFLCRVDSGGRISFANKALCDFVGRSEAELIGAELEQLVRSGSRPAVADCLQTAPDAPQHSQLELELREASGEVRLTRWSACRVADAGGAAPGLQLSGRDITDQKVYYEELLDYQEQLRQLTGRLIMTEEYERRSMAQNLEAEICQSLAEAGASIKQALKQCGEQESEQLSASLDIVQTAQERARNLSFELSPPLLNDLGLVASIEWLVGQFQRRNGLAVVFRDDGKPKAVDDEVRVMLYHVVRELLCNIVTHAGATLAEVSLAADGTFTVLEVRDDGCGFDPEQLQVPGSERRGYGLFAATERVSQLGGRLEIVSAPGKGATIRISTPPRATPALKAREKVRQSHPGGLRAQASRQQRKLLLVEHQPLLRDGLRLLLAEIDGVALVGEAEDEAQALELAQQSPPDIVLVDADLPGGCVGVVQGIRALQPGARLIVLAGEQDKRCLSACFEAGATACLSKDNLHDGLAQVVGNSAPSLRILSSDLFELLLEDFNRYQDTTIADRQVMLSRREREVICFIADGLAIKTIAVRLGLSSKTVETYRKRITEKLGVDGVAELTKYAIQQGWTSMPGEGE